MCGIQLLVRQNACAADASTEKLWADLTLANSRRGPDAHDELTITLRFFTLRIGAHVLHLRGAHPQPQPLINAQTGDMLCWNGEVFSGLPVGNSNDGLMLFHELQRVKKLHPKDFILRVFSRIEGPYAFVYVDRESETVWFARDVLGRRSLLVKRQQGLWLASVARAGEAWAEVAAQRIFQLDLAAAPQADEVGEPPLLLAEHEWRYADNAGDSPLVLPFGRVTDTHGAGTSSLGAPSAGLPEIDAAWLPFVDGLQATLSAALLQRTDSVPHHGDPGTPRIGILFSGGIDCITLAALLAQQLPVTEPIELFNVAFENPRQLKHAATTLSQPKYNVPDRKTGIQGWIELRRLYPDQEWRFVEVDVPYAQVLMHREHIRSLLCPADTVMDMSIGMAIWFASRGIGRIKHDAQDDEGVEYTGQARVLILGMGADEQLGGYSRHRVAWDRRHQWADLGAEIRLDVERISCRNLGRDDRVVSDHAREARYPFLAAEVVAFLANVPLDRKMDMRYPRGIGEKILLRLLAQRIGLVNACMLPKRAIQFGARTAKMETSQSKGQDTL
ncbi:hypothetical protein LPJ66_001075 [Kickxella alabastrina]|uniref:Uncharacterized protein n=1 Tax=Kickxella alabastrina TaxID=61397 RepID=A0ACC1IUD6_9FUNG|nr:hypothetical protein LPJ66_001075 [Kickxella alabastrina]